MQRLTRRALSAGAARSLAMDAARRALSSAARTPAMDARRALSSAAPTPMGYHRLKSGILVPSAALKQSRFDQILWDSLHQSAKNDWIYKWMLAIAGLFLWGLQKLLTRFTNSTAGAGDLSCMLRTHNLLLWETLKTVNERCEKSQHEIQKLRQEINTLKLIIDLRVLRLNTVCFDPEKVVRQLKVTPPVLKDGKQDDVKSGIS